MDRQQLKTGVINFFFAGWGTAKVRQDLQGTPGKLNMDVMNKVPCTHTQGGVRGD